MTNVHKRSIIAWWHREKCVSDDHAVRNESSCKSDIFNVRTRYTKYTECREEALSEHRIGRALHQQAVEYLPRVTVDTVRAVRLVHAKKSQVDKCTVSTLTVKRLSPWTAGTSSECRSRPSASSSIRARELRDKPAGDDERWFRPQGRGYGARWEIQCTYGEAVCFLISRHIDVRRHPLHPEAMTASDGYTSAKRETPRNRSSLAHDHAEDLRSHTGCQQETSVFWEAKNVLKNCSNCA